MQKQDEKEKKLKEEQRIIEKKEIEALLQQERDAAEKRVEVERKLMEDKYNKMLDE